MLLSSGLGGAGAFWAPQLDALSGRYRVVTYDHRGTNGSPGLLPEPYSIAAMADDVADVLDAVGAEQAHVIGHALGGIVGLELARRQPCRVESLVVVNGWVRAGAHTRRCFDVRRDLLRGSGPEAYVRAQPLFLYPAAWMEAHAERLAREDAHGVAHFQGSATLLARIEALLAFDATGWLGEVRCPVLVAASRDDLLVPWTASEAVAAGLPDARLWTVPEGGHGFTVTQAGPFNEAVLEFLERNRFW